ncbi:MAG: hypothetical protein AB7F88_10095 [Pyrinomonadaceae bacterium]
MKAYKTYTTVSDSKQLVLSNVPFRVGEKVEIVVLTAENGERAERVRRLKNLFQETQSLPQVQVLSEDDILREVEAYRNGK